MTRLYCRKKESDEPASALEGYSILEFTPSLCGGLYLRGENKKIKTTFVRVYFQIMTRGRMRIFCAVSDEGEVVHTSYVVPRCSKFPFLCKGDYEIGPCVTAPQHRGKGIYPSVLRLICGTVGDEETIFYMMVSESTAASVKGIEKAGFRRCGSVEKTRLFKRYKMTRSTDD